MKYCHHKSPFDGRVLESTLEFPKTVHASRFFRLLATLMGKEKGQHSVGSGTHPSSRFAAHVTSGILARWPTLPTRPVSTSVRGAALPSSTRVLSIRLNAS